MALDIWFKSDIARILDTIEQQINRDKGCDPTALEVIADLRTLFGLNEQAAGYEVKAERWIKSVT